MEEELTKLIMREWDAVISKHPSISTIELINIVSENLNLDLDTVTINLNSQRRY